MTTKQRREHKFGNAMRAWKGSGMSQAPERKAIFRVNRWAARIKDAGDNLPRVIVFSRPKT